MRPKELANENGLANRAGGRVKEPIPDGLTWPVLTRSCMAGFEVITEGMTFLAWLTKQPTPIPSRLGEKGLSARNPVFFAGRLGSILKRTDSHVLILYFSLVPIKTRLIFSAI